MNKIISGIQQVGIGVKDAREAFAWYNKHFGMDVLVFEDAATAAKMTPYTGGKAQTRFAMLALNMQSGGGFEIWQYESRIPQPPSFKVQLGDTGIFAVRLKSKNVAAAHQAFVKAGLDIVGGLHQDPAGNDTFFIRDPWNNLFQLVNDTYWYANTKANNGGVAGTLIGVSNMERSVDFYKKILGFNKTLYDVTGVFDDLKPIEGGGKKFRRVLLRQNEERLGAFSRLLGPAQVELIQALDGYEPRKIFENRYWGDLGFIHLCFDVTGMDLHEADCKNLGYPFTINSGNRFDMGEASGQFCYNEDPDGTLMEYVETHKVPIFKPFGLYLNLRNRKKGKPLPDLVVKAMALNRVNV